MFSLLKQKPPALVGLDIHPDEVRLLHISQSKSGLVIEDYAIAALPAAAIMDGKIKQFRLVQSVTEQLVKQTHSRGCSAAIGLPGNLVISKRIKISSSLTKVEQEADIAANLPRHFPAMADGLSYDFVALEMMPNGLQEILLVVVQSELMNAYVSLASQAGLIVKIVDVDSYAQRRLEAQPNFFQQTPIAPTLLETTWQEDQSRLKVCGGLAMRSIPTW